MDLKPRWNLTEDEERADSPLDVLAMVVSTIAGLAGAMMLVAVLAWLNSWLDKLINLIP